MPVRNLAAIQALSGRGLSRQWDLEVGGHSRSPGLGSSISPGGHITQKATWGLSATVPPANPAVHPATWARAK